MSPEYVLEKSLSSKPHCSSLSAEHRAMHIKNLIKSPGYAEPGYASSRKGVLLSNWNHFPSRVTSILERMGYEAEWEDEWIACDDCFRIFRSKPDCYGWQPSYMLLDSTFLCLDCAQDSIPEYLQTLENNTDNALNNSGIAPADYGYTLLEGDFRNGWYSSHDSPEKIFERLSPEHPNLLFRISSVGQFEVTFEIWERK
jgi:hypothetical protein